MVELDPSAAQRVHYATDPRIRHLAEARWRLNTGGTRMDWLCLGKDNPEALISEARDWVRAAVAAGILARPGDEAVDAPASRKVQRVLAYLSGIDGLSVSEDAHALGLHIVAMLDGPEVPADNRGN